MERMEEGEMTERITFCVDLILRTTLNALYTQIKLKSTRTRRDGISTEINEPKYISNE